MKCNEAPLNSLSVGYAVVNTLIGQSFFFLGEILHEWIRFVDR